jgi:hypothetical protein
MISSTIAQVRSTQQLSTKQLAGHDQRFTERSDENEISQAGKLAIRAVCYHLLPSKRFMANYIHVFNSIVDFYRDLKPLIDKLEMYFYIEKIAESRRIVNLVESIDQITKLIDKNYKGFYITSEAIDKEKDQNFFDDDFFSHVIEGIGGRFNETEVEKIGLRIVSKTPDEKVKVFQKSVKKYLKSSDDYGVGIGPVAGSFYKKIFYKKRIIFGKTMWFDFARKVHPVLIDGKDPEQ